MKEEEIMAIITFGGDARSSCLKAVKAAQQGKLEEADKLIENGKKNLTIAHNTQTKLIQAELRGESGKISLLMVHAQDHLMNAITVMDLATEMINQSKRIIDLENTIKGVKST